VTATAGTATSGGSFMAVVGHIWVACAAADNLMAAVQAGGIHHPSWTPCAPRFVTMVENLLAEQLDSLNGASRRGRAHPMWRADNSADGAAASSIKAKVILHYLLIVHGTTHQPRASATGTCCLTARSTGTHAYIYPGIPFIRGWSSMHSEYVAGAYTHPRTYGQGHTARARARSTALHQLVSFVSDSARLPSQIALAAAQSWCCIMPTSLCRCGRRMQSRRGAC
jgi:hypothetical protein